MAVAAFAAGITISNAQVYSANVVGYASVPSLTPNQYYMMECPFAVGVSNGVNEVFGTSLPDGSAVYTWNSGSQTFSTVVYDSTGGNNGLSGVVWFQADDTTPATSLPTIPPGRGFFFVPNGPMTNVFSGAVSVNVGTSNSIPLPTPNQYYMLGSLVPYSGFVTNGTASGGGANMNNLPDGSAVYQWNPVSQTFTTTVFDSTGGNNGLSGVVWFQADDTTPAPCPQIGVGDGVFLAPNGSYTWTTGL